ncbi:hypothetical protein ACQP1W_00620 [Spirillospora sp. CA-255316]
MTVHLRLAGRQPFLSSRRLATADFPGQCVIAARELSFVTPLDLTAITALAHSRAAGGDRVRLLLPGDPRVTSYLERMDLMNRLPGRCELDRTVRAKGRADRSDSLLEITPVTSTAEGAVASERVFSVARANLGEQLGALTVRVVGELIDNAASHGASETGSFAAAQIYLLQRRLEFAVCDTGVGVLEHLRRNPTHLDLNLDHEALTRALQPGASGEREVRGNGLPDLLQMAGDAGRTRLVLRSGNGLLHTTSGVDNPSARSGPVPDKVKGTWAWLRVTFP